MESILRVNGEGMERKGILNGEEMETEWRLNGKRIRTKRRVNGEQMKNNLRGMESKLRTMKSKCKKNTNGKRTDNLTLRVSEFIERFPPDFIFEFHFMSFMNDILVLSSLCIVLSRCIKTKSDPSIYAKKERQPFFSSDIKNTDHNSLCLILCTVNNLRAFLDLFRIYCLEIE